MGHYFLLVLMEAKFLSSVLNSVKLFIYLLQARCLKARKANIIERNRFIKKGEGGTEPEMDA